MITPNRGQWLERLKTREIISLEIAVTAKGESFRSKYPNIFQEYSIKVVRNDVIFTRWKNDPLQLYQCCVNFSVFPATSALGISMETFKSQKPLEVSK